MSQKPMLICMSHLPTLGLILTWKNGRFGNENVALRLDRAVCNEEWINFWRSTSCSALVRHQSDDNPVLVSVVFSSLKHASPFKFFKVWSSHSGCRELVLNIWNQGVRGHVCFGFRLSYGI